MASAADPKACSKCLKEFAEDDQIPECPTDKTARVCPDCKAKQKCICCGSTSDHKGKITELPPRFSTEQDGASTSDDKDKDTAAPPGFNMEKAIADAVTKMLSEVMKTQEDMNESMAILERFSANIKKYVASYEVLKYRVMNLEARVAELEDPVDPMSPEEEHAMIPSDADDDFEDAIIIEYPDDL